MVRSPSEPCGMPLAVGGRYWERALALLCYGHVSTLVWRDEISLRFKKEKGSVVLCAAYIPYKVALNVGAIPAPPQTCDKGDQQTGLW